MLKLLRHPLLGPYFLTYRWHLIGLLFSAFLASVFEGVSAGLAVPLLQAILPEGTGTDLPTLLAWVSDAFDRIESIEHRVLIVLAILALAMLLKSTFVGLSNYWGTYISSRIMESLRHRLTAAFFEARIDFFTVEKTGDLVERLLYFCEKVEGLIGILVRLAARMISLVVLIGLLFAISWKLTLFAIFLGCGVAASITFYLKVLGRISRQNAELNIELSSAAFENISAIRLIKSYAKEQFQRSALFRIISEQRGPHQMVAFGNSLIDAITEMLAMLCLLFIFGFGFFIDSAQSKEALLLKLLPFVYILSRLIPAIKIINKSRGAVVSRIQFADMLHEMLQRASQYAYSPGGNRAPQFEKTLNIDISSFAYSSDKPVLCDVKLSIKKGQHVAFVGESGSGKSTLVNLLLGLYPLQQGQIQLDGVALDTLDHKKWLDMVGYVGQEVFLFNASLEENIKFSLKGNQEADSALWENTLNASSVNKFYESADQAMGEGGRNLSGGQRQRISIARALIKQPEILIFDEATSALDNQTEGEILDALARIAQGKTVITIAHRLNTVRNADIIYVFKNGRIVESGTFKQLEVAGGEFATLSKQH